MRNAKANTYVILTKSRRWTHVYEVYIDIPGASPNATGQEFPTEELAEAWLRTSQGKNFITQYLAQISARTAA